MTVAEACAVRGVRYSDAFRLAKTCRHGYVPLVSEYGYSQVARLSGVCKSTFDKRYSAERQVRMVLGL